MASGIDHIVIATADPDAAASFLTEQLGLAFTAGGRHAGLGTFNRIAFLGDAYLELMGVDDAAGAQGWTIGAAAVRTLLGDGGFATYGLVDDTIRNTVARLQVNGSRIGPVVHGSRERPDGEQVEWWTASPPLLGPDQPPFLIKHLSAGAEWGADAMAARRGFVHPIGSPVVIEQLQLAVPDPLGLAADCRRDLGMEFQLVGDVAVCPVGRQVISLVAGGGEPSLVIGAGIRESRSVMALGMHFEIVPATLSAPATS